MMFRNRDKKEALEVHHMVLLLLKIIFDSAARIIFFSCIIYVFHNGQFSSLWTTSSFYLMVLLQIVVNVVFNKHKPSFRPTYLIGKSNN